MSTEDMKPKEIKQEIAWIDCNVSEFKYVMDIARYHNLDHLLGIKRHEHGTYVKVKESVLSQLMERVQGTDEFSLLLRAKMQDTGNNVFKW